MPIRIPDKLPATQTLRKENIFVMTDKRAVTQDIRPLEIAIVNLMPTKVATETQLARLLGNTPLQVNLTLIAPESHAAKNTSQEHLESFYTTFDAVKDRKFDGMVITGAPIEQLPFEAVDYWQELCAILDWTQSHVTSTFHICWAAQAGLYHHYGVKKYQLAEKLSGVFPHTVERKSSILFRGFDDVFMVPHSRHTTIKREEVEAVPALKILASSQQAGVYAVSNDQGRQIFITGHSEYDWDTLQNEYLRDKAAGLDIAPPRNYYPRDDDRLTPVVSWRSYANLLYSNWLNYFVYQLTPYDIDAINS